jgi:hypothetical protein
MALVGGLAIALACWTPAGAQYRGNDAYRGANRLTGTYQLDRSRSDRPQQVIDDVTRSLPRDDRARVSDDLMDRLDPPDWLAIERRGQTVSIMSSNSPRITFDANGSEQSERGFDGRPIVTHAALYGEEVAVTTTTGSRGADFSARFEPIPGGLRMTRVFSSDIRDISVSVTSVYRRTSDVPRWTVYRDGADSLLVPDNMRLTARLVRTLEPERYPEGERFSLTVVEPARYRGAVLSGRMSTTGDRGGRSELVFDFDRIRTADGRWQAFDGEIDSVRTPDGQLLRVDRSGAVHDRSDATLLEHGAIGAGIGAAIGAIVGGGKGAGVGAIIGGAGTLLLDSRGSVTIPAGTQFNIVAVAPAPASMTR